MRILFFGNADFGLPSLEKLFHSKYNLISVITNKDKKSGRGNKYSPTPIKKYSENNNINLIEVDDLNTSFFREKIEATQPDIIIVIAFRLLPSMIFNIPSHGTINLHASLLPKYRGAAPIQRAILNGDSETGVSTFFIDEGIDKGRLILQKNVKIDKMDDFGTLHNNLSKIGANLVIDSIEHIINNNPLTEQTGEASYAKKIKKNENQINWAGNSEQIFNTIRAFSPYPGAFSYILNKRIKLLLSKKIKSEGKNIHPGNICLDDNRFLVGTSGQPIEILELQQEGKKRMKAIEFINGLPQIESIDLRFEFKE